MQQTGLWSKMRRLVRGGASRSELPPTDAIREDAVGASTSTAVTESTDAQPGGSEALSTQQKPMARTPGVDEPRGAYPKLVELIDSMQMHQREQDRRAGQIAGSMSELATTLSQIRAEGKQQSQTLERVAGELASANQHWAGWEGKLDALPELAHAQRDALTAIREQMTSADQRQQQFTESLGSFRDAVRSLGDATTSSGVAIKNLQMTTLESEERIAELLEQQNRRFMMLFYLMLTALLAVAIGGLIFTLK